MENLTEDASYWIKLRGFSRSIVNPALVYEGDWSEIRNLVLKGGCQVAKAYTVIDSQSMALHLNAGVIAGLGVTVLLVAGALLSLAFWRRYWSESYYYLEDTSSNKSPTPDWDVKSAVPAHLFVQYVQKLRSSGFSQEFESLNLENTNLVKPVDISSRPGNRTRNRYNNILACRFIKSLTRQDKTRQDKTRQDKTRQDKTRISSFSNFKFSCISR